MSQLTSHKAFRTAVGAAAILTSTALQANPLGIDDGIAEDYSRGADTLVRMQSGKTGNPYQMQIINGRTQRLCNVEIEVTDSAINATKAECEFYSANDFKRGLSEERGYKPSKELNKAYKEFKTWRADNPLVEPNYNADNIVTPIESAMHDSGVWAYEEGIAKDDRIRVATTDAELSNKDSTCLNLSDQAAVCFTTEYVQPFESDTFTVDMHVVSPATGALVSSNLITDKLEWGEEVNDYNSGEEVQSEANSRVLESAGTPTAYGYR